MERGIFTYGNYFDKFYQEQEQKVRDKIDYVLDLVKHEDRIPKMFFKYLESTEGIYEIRVSTTFKEVRIFSFFDEGKIVIIANCIVKKSQKTPKNDIELAHKIKREYFNNKK